MVFGGIIIRADQLDTLERAIQMWRDAHRMHSELKWTKVSNQKLGEYKSLVDLFFTLAGGGALRFNSVVFDTSQIDYNRYHKGDRELGFYRFFYQFLLHAVVGHIHAERGRLLVFFDQRTTSYKLSHLCSILNNGIANKYGVEGRVVRNIQAVRSHECPLMQLADVLMGAIGYQNNDCHLRPGAKRGKIELAHYIAGRCHLTDLKQNTPRRMRHFGIWQFRFGGGKKK